MGSERVWLGNGKVKATAPGEIALHSRERTWKVFITWYDRCEEKFGTMRVDDVGCFAVLLLLYMLSDTCGCYYLGRVNEIIWTVEVYHRRGTGWTMRVIEYGPCESHYQSHTSGTV